MGILNVTPDSFFDAGKSFHYDDAIRHGDAMVCEGADIIDVGGESSRPGAKSISLQEELDRVIPVIEALKQRTDVALSIDTVKTAVMDEAMRAGAVMINDINALQAEGAMQVAAGSGATICLMHMQGEPRSMQDNPRYTEVIDEVCAFLKNRVTACLGAGIAADKIILDPGIGFGKTPAHNLELVAGLKRFTGLGYVVLAGLSRKSMIGKIVKNSVSGLYASIALAVLAYSHGARILRVHDVAPTVEALAITRAALSAGMD
jgi:dihydropteroate synthase